MNLTNRRDELKRLKKDQVIDVCLSHWDNWITLENKLTDQENKHKEEMRGLRESYQAGADETEEEYNKSHCYKYVAQLLYDLSRTKGELESTQELLEDIQQNGYEELRTQITQLRNKIVRMA